MSRFLCLCLNDGNKDKVSFVEIVVHTDTKMSDQYCQYLSECYLVLNIATVP